MGEPARPVVGQAQAQGFLERSERAMERWTTNLWGLLLPARDERGEAVAMLLRQCDDNALIVGRQRVVVPNAFVIELLPEIHQQLSAGTWPVAPVLADRVNGAIPSLARSQSTCAPHQTVRPGGFASTAASPRPTGSRNTGMPIRRDDLQSRYP